MKRKYLLQTWFIPNFILIDGGQCSLLTLVLKVSKRIKIKGYQFSIVLNEPSISFIDSCLKSIQLREYAFIIHDRDNSEHVHAHIYLHTRKQTTIKTLAKIFDILPRQIEIVSLRNKYLRYLIHKDQPHKYSYDITDVITNINDFEVICGDALISTPSDYLKQVYSLLFCREFTNYGQFVHYLMRDFPYLVDTATKNAYSISLILKNKFSR